MFIDNSLFGWCNVILILGGGLRLLQWCPILEARLSELELFPLSLPFAKTRRKRSVEKQTCFVFYIIFLLQNSVLGRCEVLYEVTRIPRSVALARPDLFPSADKCDNMNFVEIFKTRNFSNCEYRAELHFGLPMSRKCQPGSNACQDFWNVSTKKKPV
jgi:hypothetical protein